MQVERVPLSATGQAPQIVLDYLSGKEGLRDYYAFTPDPSNFPAVVQEKRKQSLDRALLVQVLIEQYEQVQTSNAVQENIAALSDANTFTVVAAHQPLLFLGPLYFVHKAASAIKVSRIAEEQLPGCRVVPVFWMGSEDHDFEELGHANVFGKRIQWDETPGGPVGRMDCGSIESALAEYDTITGSGDIAGELKQLFRSAYGWGRTFAQATRMVLDHLFGEHGLIVMDGDDARLKRQFTDVMRAEFTKRTSSQIAGKTISRLSRDYDIQAQPRDINLFYMVDGLRERIEFDKSEGVFSVVNSNVVFDEGTIINELKEHPDRFSPNVILRGLFQETVLPNLAFIGGPAEISYWLELKSLFEHFKVAFPMLIFRDIMIWIDSNTSSKMEKVGMKTEQLFVNEDELIAKMVKASSHNELSLREEVERLRALFRRIVQKAKAVDPTLVNSVGAEEQKAVNALMNLESKMLRAEKRHSETLVTQIRTIRSRLFPNGVLHERFDNFSNIYLREGQEMIGKLVDASDPFDGMVKALRS